MCVVTCVVLRHMIFVLQACISLHHMHYLSLFSSWRSFVAHRGAVSSIWLEDIYVFCIMWLSDQNKFSLCLYFHTVLIHPSAGMAMIGLMMVGRRMDGRTMAGRVIVWATMVWSTDAMISVSLWMIVTCSARRWKSKSLRLEISKSKIFGKWILVWYCICTNWNSSICWLFQQHPRMFLQERQSLLG